MIDPTKFGTAGDKHKRTSYLCAVVYHYADTGGEVLERLRMRHTLGGIGPDAIKKLFEKSKLFAVHPDTLWSGNKAKTTDGYIYTASIFTSRDGVTRCASSAHRIGCRTKVSEIKPVEMEAA